MNSEALRKAQADINRIDDALKLQNEVNWHCFNAVHKHKKEIQQHKKAIRLLSWLLLVTSMSVLITSLSIAFN